MQIFNNKKNKNILKMTLATLGALIIFMNGTLNVQAAEFKHKHSGGCYSTVSKSCTATHQMSTRTGSTTRHCFNCNAQVSHTTYVYWDTCYGTGQSFEQGGYHVCKTCGSTSYSWGSQSRHGHSVSTTVLSCDKENADSGKLWIESSTSEWTATEVELEAGVAIYDSSLIMAELPYSWDEQASWTDEPITRITENGTYIVYAKSADGTVISETVTVNNIDKTAPALIDIKKSESEWTNQNVTISVTADDLQPDGSKGSGLAQLPYSYDNGNNYIIENSLTVEQNGVYVIKIADVLGNVETTMVEISNIDKTAPVISQINRIGEGWQTGNIVMKVMASDLEGGSGLHENAYSLDGYNWQREPEFIINKNGTSSVYVRDVVGNTTVSEFAVTQIDVTAPMIEYIEVIPDKIWDDKVEVTILATDLQPDGSVGSGLGAEAYSVDGGLTWQSENTFVVEAGKTYDVRVRDSLMWESDGRIVARDEFPYPDPVIEDVPDTDEEEPKEPDVDEEEPDSDEDDFIENVPQEGETQNNNNKKEENASKDNKATEVSQEKPVEDLMQEEPKLETDYVKKSDKTKQYDRIAKEEMAALEEDDVNESKSEEVEQIETVELEKNKEKMVQPVQVITMPWYKTVAGKTVIVSTSAIMLGNLLGILSYLLIFSARIYCIGDMNRERKLGRVFIHRIKGGYTVYLSDSILKAASVPRYRIRISEPMLKKARNARLVVESDEKNLEVLIQESIDFEL